MTGLISAQMISDKGYPALVFRLLTPLLLLSLTTEIASAVFVNGRVSTQKIKTKPHLSMIPYFPFGKSYSPIDQPYGTLSNCWIMTQSLVDKPCGVQPWAVWYHKTWVPLSYYLPVLGKQELINYMWQEWFSSAKDIAGYLIFWLGTNGQQHVCLEQTWYTWHLGQHGLVPLHLFQ